MDSRLIHEASKTFLRKVKWLRLTDAFDSEWIYIGLADELNKELVYKLIDEHFEDDDLYLDINRTDSLKITKIIFKSRLDDYVGISDITLWDEKFKNSIQINRVGILRRGTTTSN